MAPAQAHRRDAAILLGLAAGLRTFSAPAALALSRRAPGGPRSALLAAAAAELIADKLPAMPSRLSRRGLLARLASSSISGGVVAGRPGALSGAGAALIGAVCGHRARGAFAGVPAALAEDGLALALASLGAARAAR